MEKHQNIYKYLNAENVLIGSSKEKGLHRSPGINHYFGENEGSLGGKGLG